MDETAKPTADDAVRTHLALDRTLSGRPLEVTPGRSRVELTLTPAMAADDAGLVHGGFTFSLADHAAMLAVNHPHVVLAAAEVRFTRPTRVGDTLVAEAVLDDVAFSPAPGDKPWATVKVRRGDEVVFEGRLRCYVPPRHVLEPPSEGEAG
jgi:uncharacterized protein (TIGR00369 family)